MGDAVIVMTAFLALVLVGSISVVLGSKLLDRRKFHPAPRTFARAQKKLRGVVHDENWPKAASQESLACPICMGELYPRRPRSLVSAAAETAATAAVAETEKGTVEDIEAALPSEPPKAWVRDRDHSTDSDGSESGPSRLAGTDESTAKSEAPWSTEDVVTLKTCRHAFHSRCLTTWFVIKRFDCPVCRRIYWDDGTLGTSQAGYGTMGGRTDLERRSSASSTADYWVGWVA